MSPVRTAAVTENPREIEARLGLPAESLDARYAPELHSLGDEPGAPGAWLLESGRPGTLSRKFSRVEGDPEGIAALIADRARICFENGAVSVKWEDPGSAWAELAAELGFERMPAPAVSGPGTEAPATAWVRYAEPWPHTAAPYYRQTTDFSCGPASLLMAEAHRRGGPSMNRERERAIWRRATRFTGCGVWALALQVDRDRFAMRAYDTEFLAPQLNPMEPRDARAFANEEDVRLVAEAGIEIEQRVFGIAEIIAAIDRGSRVLVLVDEARFHGEPVPHWVMAHAHRDGVLLVNDPWAETAHGESWVDASDIPMAAAELDAMAWWGDPRYRSVLVLSEP
ncbi:peptidase C39 family protein [Leucobacter massiliensis]|uniref:Uncharacterized protein n=1 Tax=Leucobacter massiliensis TaxID=1686285 RepID=A0A2S9QS10_9MICO|nr:peptidase C39 family protein [Leucobacter massiliensis]PRI12373.1 hypothetical protein B4915_01480 [Leucobacter massiliensis]